MVLPLKQMIPDPLTAKNPSNCRRRRHPPKKPHPLMKIWSPCHQRGQLKQTSWKLGGARGLPLCVCGCMCGPDQRHTGTCAKEYPKSLLPRALRERDITTHFVLAIITVHTKTTKEREEGGGEGKTDWSEKRTTDSGGQERQGGA